MKTQESHMKWSKPRRGMVISIILVIACSEELLWYNRNYYGTTNCIIMIIYNYIYIMIYIYIYMIYDCNNDSNTVIIPCSEGLFCPFIGESPMTAGGPGGPMANPSALCSAQVGASCLVDRGRSAEAHGLRQCGRWRLPWAVTGLRA